MRGLWVIGLVFAVAAAVGGAPMSVFVVHCEPTTADAVHWDALVDLVALADRYEVALSIDFSAQWAAMILDDPEKAALPGDRRSGCMGTSDARDEVDWPCSLSYSTVGSRLEDTVSLPTVRSIGACAVIEIGHALIVSQERGALRALYERADCAAVFEVVGHVYDDAALPEAFEQRFAFLHGQDPRGLRRGTVSDVLDGQAASDSNDGTPGTPLRATSSLRGPGTG